MGDFLASWTTVIFSKRVLLLVVVINTISNRNFQCIDVFAMLYLINILFSFSLLVVMKSEADWWNENAVKNNNKLRCVLGGRTYFPFLLPPKLLKHQKISQNLDICWKYWEVLHCILSEWSFKTLLQINRRCSVAFVVPVLVTFVKVLSEQHCRRCS